MHAIKFLIGFTFLNGLRVAAHSDIDYAVDFYRRFFDDNDLHARFHDHDLDARDFDFDFELEERDFDDQDLYDRDFDERDFDDEEDLFARDFFDFEEIEQRDVAQNASIMTTLFEGNRQFRSSQATQQLLKSVAVKHAPPAVFLGCSDSRISEGVVFNAKPGTLFAHRNIANQFSATDTNGNSVLSYAVGYLGAQHVIVMGHYGCGGVAAAIASPPAQKSSTDAPVESWIAPIRDLYRTSNRTEIVALRNRNSRLQKVEQPPMNDPGFRALVEENIKATVRKVAQSPAIQSKFNSKDLNLNYGKTQDVFVHGFVYNLENGEIKDLGVTVGPPGKPIPPMPFSKLTVGPNRP